MSLYDFLSVERTASSGEIEDAYHRIKSNLPSAGLRGWLIRILDYPAHLDRAYGTLIDPEKRRQYDLLGSQDRSFLYLGL